MRLVTFRYNDREQIGAMSADLDEVFPLSLFGIKADCMNSFIKETKKEDILRLEKALKENASGGIPYGSVEKCSPIPVPIQDIICLGVNYMAHAEESARYKGELFDGKRNFSVYFSKRVNRAVPDGGIIPLSENVTTELDYEAELAVVIGKDCRNIKACDVGEYIFGYTVLNDVSARDIQTRHKQWYMGKSLEGCCPMGPWIVTSDEIEPKEELEISSRVNGSLRQHSSTGLMIFKIPEVIEELSSYTELKAGSIISMGTPNGVGMGFNPPKFLKDGDIVVCSIEKIGRLTNTVRRHIS